MQEPDYVKKEDPSSHPVLPGAGVGVCAVEMAPR